MLQLAQPRRHLLWTWQLARLQAALKGKLKLFYLIADRRQLRWRQAIDKQRAVEGICLVLYDAGHEAFHRGIDFAGAAGSGGTSQTLAKTHPDFPAADTTALDDASAITAGTSPVTKQIAGLAQSGGMGGWQAGELDEGEAMKANGGANGNMEIGSLSITASQTIDFTVKVREVPR